jgi:hypothetical protein
VEIIAEEKVMKKIRILIGCCSLILIMYIGLIVYLISFAEPRITIKAEIKPISDADYQRIKERKEPFIATSQKDDFKRVELDINFFQPIAIISNRKIEFDSLQTVLGVGSKVVNLSGGDSEQDNANELKASYRENAEVYLNGASVEEFKDMFENHRIRLSWNKAGIGKEERVYNLNDLLVITN